jgi:hypothetical protein
MRAFLTFYLNMKFLELAGFFPSHFNIVLLVKFFLIRLFIYNGDFEHSFLNLIVTKCSLKWYMLKIFPKSHFFLHYALKIFIILFSFLYLIDID